MLSSETCGKGFAILHSTPHSITFFGGLPVEMEPVGQSNIVDIILLCRSRKIVPNLTRKFVMFSPFPFVSVT